MDIWVRVGPGAAQAIVGGRYGDDEPAVLLVKVTARAVDGAANAAVLRDLAKAFDVRPRQVTLLRGSGARRKQVRIEARDDVEEGRLHDRFLALLRGIDDAQ